MKGFALVLVLSGSFVSGCRVDVQPDHQAEWREVLVHKASAIAPDAEPDAKQRFADSVRTFLQRHPDHGRAREVWQQLQLQFADDLAGLGRHQDAMRYYQEVLALDPENEEARIGAETASERVAISRGKLLQLEKGMTGRDVMALLGQPLPGWTTENDRPEAKFEAWYYRTQTGTIAGVYFRDGRVFAAEEESSAPLGRLGS
jgi:tetratricopeptide (TPR) repeat protein